MISAERDSRQPPGSSKRSAFPSPDRRLKNNADRRGAGRPGRRHHRNLPTDTETGGHTKRVSPVRQHDVRLPEEFQCHVVAAADATHGLPTPMFDEFGMRDRNWLGLEFADQLWKPASLDHGQAYVEVDADWWLLHAD